MTHQFDKLCTDIRAALSKVEKRLQQVRAAGAGKADGLEARLRAEIEAMDKKLADNAASLKAAQAHVAGSIEEEHSATKTKIAELIAKGDTKALLARSAAADGLAHAMALLAANVVDQAVKAALEAAATHHHVHSVRRAAGAR